MPRRLLPLIVCLLATTAAWAEDPPHRRLAAVPFTDVTFHDAFWTPRLETNRTKTLPHDFLWCERTGRLDNFAKAAKAMKGDHRGAVFNDSDVYKVIEGAAYSLASHPDPVLERTVDDAIYKIAAAQQQDGYLNTYFTVAEPGMRWTNLRDKHELYCAGHLIEAAVAHYRATGKRSLLDVAVRFADHIDKVFGPNRRCGVPGHEEIELALVKLYQVTGERRYLELAQFFIDARGDRSRRELWGKNHQDHLPVRQQREIVGHAVRAMYLYAGAADLAAYTGDRPLVDAMGRLWRDVVERKMYVTGGIGATNVGEAFGDAYQLPNDTAYCETCAGIGLALWAHRLNLMEADAQYADIFERVVYNNVLAGVGMDGTHFFYVNPLASNGRHHRQPFFECACCPSNVVRFVPSLPGYVYAVGRDGVFVNLYVAGMAKIFLNDNRVTLAQETKYPWEGDVVLSVEPQKPAEFTIHLRIPGWCRGAKMSVNGQPVALDVNKGYAHVRRRWQSGDRVRLELPMPVERIAAHPRVKADEGRVALQRGPIVYCFEAVDNSGRAKDLALPGDPCFNAEYRGNLLGGLTAITGVGADGRKVTAVPYDAWDHREPGEMVVWIRQESTATPPRDDEAWKGKLYRQLDAHK